MTNKYDPDDHIKAGCELDEEDLHMSDCKLLGQCLKHPGSKVVNKIDGGVACLRCHVEDLPKRLQVGWITLKDDTDDV